MEDRPRGGKLPLRMEELTSQGEAKLIVALGGSRVPIQVELLSAPLFLFFISSLADLSLFVMDAVAVR